MAKYAERTARKKQSIHNEVLAYEVFSAESKHVFGLEKYYRHLVAIHAAPLAADAG
jgi:hypothetical protein